MNHAPSQKKMSARALGLLCCYAEIYIDLGKLGQSFIDIINKASLTHTERIILKNENQAVASFTKVVNKCLVFLMSLGHESCMSLM